MSHNFSTKLPVFTKKRLRLLESTELLTLKEKIEILEMFNQDRLLTESRIPEASDAERKEHLVELIDYLGLWSFPSSKVSTHTGKKFDFLIISANEATNEYMKQFEYDIDQNELGLMYGYHPKSILAFSRLVDRQETGEFRTAYMYFHSKVFSKDFLAEEDEYHRQQWEELRKLSPLIISEAEDYFRSQT